MRATGATADARQGLGLAGYAIREGQEPAAKPRCMRAAFRYESYREPATFTVTISMPWYWR